MRKLAPAPASADLIHDPKSSQNPEILLAETNRLAWIFNWPKAGPLYLGSIQKGKSKKKSKATLRAERRTRSGRSYENPFLRQTSPVPSAALNKSRSAPSCPPNICGL